MMTRMIYRGRLDNVVFEFSLADSSTCNIVLCDGLPSVPRQKELMTYLAGNGFNVFYPRYGGTWESEGEFLAKSPAEDIIYFIQFLKRGEVKELYGNNIFSIKGPIHLVGSSFGATVALSIANSNDVEKIISFSPIVDFSIHNNNGTEQDLGWLKDFIRKAFGNGYRFKDENWDLMMGGSIFNPPKNIEPTKGKSIIIAYDKSDATVEYTKVSNYASKNKIQTIVSENIGHLSFSKVSQDMWKSVFDFLHS